MDGLTDWDGSCVQCSVPAGSEAAVCHSWQCLPGPHRHRSVRPRLPQAADQQAKLQQHNMLFFPEKSLYSEVCEGLELSPEEFLVRELDGFIFHDREERERERVM